MNRFHESHVIERHVEALLGQRSELSAGEASAAECSQIMSIGPFDGPQDIRAVTRAANGNEQIAGAGQVFQLLDKYAIESLVVAPGQNVWRIVGQTENAQTLLPIVIEVFATKSSLAEVLAEVRRIGTAAAVADHEHEAAAAIAIINGVGQLLDLGRIHPQQFLAG